MAFEITGNSQLATELTQAYNDLKNIQSNMQNHLYAIVDQRHKEVQEISDSIIQAAFAAKGINPDSVFVKSKQVP